MNPEEYGKVIAAALFYNNCIYIGREGHHVIFPMEERGVLRKAKQGFVTENGYFVDRKTGLLLAEYFHQIKEKHFPKDQLLSEDLVKEPLAIKQYKKEYLYKERK